MPIVTSNTTISAVFTPRNLDSEKQNEFRASEVQTRPGRESSVVADTNQRTGTPNDLGLPSTSRVEGPSQLPSLNDIIRPDASDSASPSVVVDISSEAQNALKNAEKEIPAQSKIQDAEFAADLAASTGKQMSEQPATTVMAQANTAPQQAIASLI
ncbi:MAG: hypothetical protein R3204_03455 [Oceanospirillum sp.]|nr:hypothetical protein [Oceanospirillum sp.]